jgi:thiamine biosynthesis lipoprotein
VDSLSFEAIGTKWTIDLYAHSFSPELEAAIHERISSFDLVYSRFRGDSLVTRISREAGTYSLPDDAQPLLHLYKKLYQLTGGRMTPLIGKVLVDAGYDSQYRLEQTAPLTSPPRWEDVVSYIHPLLTVSEPVLVDVGAAGKGYLVDLVGEVLASHGVSSFCIDAGGDMLVVSPQEPLRVGLENPDAADEVVGIATLDSGSICASAGNRRTWGKFHHTIDPLTLKSPTHLKAVWVVAESALVADGLATALSFAPAVTLLQDFSFSYALLREDGTMEASKDFPAEFFTT